MSMYDFIIVGAGSAGCVLRGSRSHNIPKSTAGSCRTCNCSCRPVARASSRSTSLVSCARRKSSSKTCRVATLKQRMRHGCRNADVEGIHRCDPDFGIERFVSEGRSLHTPGDDGAGHHSVPRYAIKLLHQHGTDPRTIERQSEPEACQVACRRPPLCEMIHTLAGQSQRRFTKRRAGKVKDEAMAVEEPENRVEFPRRHSCAVAGCHVRRGPRSSAPLSRRCPGLIGVCL